MSLPDVVRLHSVTFKVDCAARLPGTSSTAHYIPASDYPLRFYPGLQLIEARCRDGVNAMPGERRVRWYPAGNAKDLDVDPASLPVETAITTTPEGAVTAPAPRMRQTPGGGFERVIDEDGDPASTPAEEPTKKGGWPKGKPRKRAAAPASTPTPPAVVPHIPQVRVRAEKGD